MNGRREERRIRHVSGLALLMNVYRGYGSCCCRSGWHVSLRYDAIGLKDGRDGGPQEPRTVRALLDAGYTVVTANHRAAPRFHYPAPVEHVQRAVRFVRLRASLLGASPTRLAGGGSSGAHLPALVAALGDAGAPEDPDPVNREPATLQCLGRSRDYAGGSLSRVARLLRENASRANMLKLSVVKDWEEGNGEQYKSLLRDVLDHQSNLLRSETRLDRMSILKQRFRLRETPADSDLATRSAPISCTDHRVDMPAAFHRAPVRITRRRT